MRAPVESFAERVYALVWRIPRGKAVSYGGVAAMLGYPRAARGVGGALSALPPGTDVPWWRVVNRDGRISLPGPGGLIQRKLLREEGVRFGPDDRLDWARHGWSGEDGTGEGASGGAGE